MRVRAGVAGFAPSLAPKAATPRLCPRPVPSIESTPIAKKERRQLASFFYGEAEPAD
jgi:hypothetical protein